MTEGPIDRGAFDSLPARGAAPAAPDARLTAESGELVRVTGALAEARPLRGAALYELVRVGERGLLGEVIRLERDVATVQIYEDTTGLTVGEPVSRTGEALTVRLGPGLLGSVLDGVARPLPLLAAAGGDFIPPGLTAPTLDPAAGWAFNASVAAGAQLEPGDVLGTVEERAGIVHRILVPPTVRGLLVDIRSGVFSVEEPVGRLADGTPLRLSHPWPVRRPRPVWRRLSGDRPLVTGQRVLDLLFPVAEGGTVSVPGGFGTGKTVIEQSLAKFAATDFVVYVGCGERGNEMADVLNEFPQLVDPYTGRSVMDRTVLVVNTSNMPVAAREASVYLGITVAEYFRDMGYRVAVMADSLSRWAEALREIGARLQEMPGEEGYPTYLGNRMASFYERAGRAEVLGQPRREGAVTLIAAISPPGGDFSEPVTQAALRVTGGLWALDAALANQRQFPSVDWETSYSLYAKALAPWFEREVGSDWPGLRRDTMELLQRDRELRDIAGLIGAEALQDSDRLVLEAAAVTREVLLGQNAYDPDDARSTLEKTHLLATLCRQLYAAAQEALDAGHGIEDLDLGSARHAVAAVRRSPAAQLESLSATAVQAIRRLAVSARGPEIEGGQPEGPAAQPGRPPDRAAGGAPPEEPPTAGAQTAESAGEDASSAEAVGPTGGGSES